MKLQTKRLILREWNKKDIPSLLENINNIKVTKWLLVVPYPYKLKDAKWWIKHCKENIKEKPRTNFDFAIELKSERRAIGCIGLNKVDKFQGTATIGYWLGEKYWKQGIMSEAFEELLNFSFNKLKLRRIDIFAFAENEASNNLIKKMGFKYEGIRRQKSRDKATNKIHDDVIYGMLKTEWKKDVNKK